ncbi:MAG: alpha/beta fold hydrolase [Candidatus Eremiobacteraeota bacterium]|nr:alpha/beta fold hydrolase [Candidatus Eremiobacteraeota bacterium]
MRRRHFVSLVSAVPGLSYAFAASPISTAPVISRGYDDARVLIDRLQRLDDSRILPVCRTALYDHGLATDVAVVLFHGFTNCPAQYALMAQRLHARGCNVLVPRYPEHGDVDRMTTRLEGLTAERLMAAAMEAIDAARGLGKRLVISGLSLGGVLVAWLATQRSDIDRVVALAPAFGLGYLPYPFSVFAAGIMRAMPWSRYAWWDDKLKEKITPMHAYPRFPLRALGECYKIGELTIGAQAPLGGRTRTEMIFALNPKDPAVNNDVTAQLSDYWNSNGLMRSSVVWMKSFPAIHDVIEPDNPHECIARCYPPLVDLILG